VNKTKIAKVDIEKNLTAVEQEDKLSPELMKLLEDNVPDFVKEYAADGTAILRWNHELLIMFEEILRLDHGWNEDMLESFEKRVKEMLPVVHKMKLEDTKLLRKADFAVALDIVERNKQLFKAEQSGISLPSKSQTQKLLDKKTNG
jgi:hypothetical protein